MLQTLPSGPWESSSGVDRNRVKQINVRGLERPEAMGGGARSRPSQQRNCVPLKCGKVGAKYGWWASLLGLLVSGLFFSHALLPARLEIPRTHSQTRFDFRTSGGDSNETLLKYALFNPSVTIERERVKYVLKATDFGSKDIRQVLYRNATTKRRMSAKIRQERTWLFLFATRAFEPHFPRFVQLAKAWLGNRGDFDPRVMQDLVQTVKGPIDRNAADWSASEGTHGDTSSWGKRYPSCAVVGNSGVLLREDYGRRIDSHDMVIRLNNAEIDPYTRHVGSKTTLSFVNSNILRSCSVRPDCWCQAYGAQVPIMVYICQANHFIHTTRCMSEHKSPLLVTPALLDALCAAVVKHYSVSNFMQTTGQPASRWDAVHHDEDFHYSSGMEAVVLALGICDGVDMFGFGKFSYAAHHYHTGQKEELKLHDYAAEYLFYDDLVRNRTVPFLSDAGISIPPVRIYY